MVIQANKCLECDDSSLCKSPESTPSNADCGAVEVVPCRPTGILVIEDAQLMLKALTETLRKRGFVVWAAPDGREGVDLYRCFGTQIDIVLSDVQMPVLDGPKAIDSLRESSPYGNRAAPSPHRCSDCECSRVPQSMDRTTIKVSVSDESMCLATPLRGVDDTGLVPIARNELAAQCCTVLLSILYCRLLR